MDLATLNLSLIKALWGIRIGANRLRLPSLLACSIERELRSDSGGAKRRFPPIAEIHRGTQPILQHISTAGQNALSCIRNLRLGAPCHIRVRTAFRPKIRRERNATQPAGSCANRWRAKAMLSARAHPAARRAA